MKNVPLVLALLALAGCGGSGTADPAAFALRAQTETAAPVGVGNALAAAPEAALIAAESRAFLLAAYQDGLGEIALAERARQASQDPAVIKYAQRMVLDHTRANAAIATLAQAKNLPLPTGLDAGQLALSARLGTLTGEPFGRAYLEANVIGNERTVLLAKLQSDRGTEADVRLFANVNLPILETHLALAEESNEMLDPSVFLVDFYRNGLAEMQLATLAAQKASSADVKNFAQRMVRQHTEVNERLASLIRQRGLQLPGDTGALRQETLTQFQKFTGADFDKAYMDSVVVEHMKDLRKTRLQAQQGRDQDIRTVAQVLALAQATHLASAIEIDRRIAPSFLYDGYQQAVAQLQLSQLTLLQSNNAQVRTSARQSITDQTAAVAQLRQLAQMRDIALPTESAPEALWRLVDLANSTGMQFDREFVKFSLDLAETQEKRLTAEAQAGTEADLRDFAQDRLPRLTAAVAGLKQLRQQFEQPVQQPVEEPVQEPVKEQTSQSSQLQTRQAQQLLQQLAAALR